MVPDVVKHASEAQPSAAGEMKRSFSEPKVIYFKENIKKALATVLNTVKSLPRTPVLGRFLAASFFYNNAMNTVVVFLALFGREQIGLGTQEFFPVFALMALTAGAGSFALGKLSDYFGPVRMIKLALLIWLAIVVLLIFVSSFPTFLFAGAVGGIVFGGIWTLNRHMITRIAPKEKIAELFGFEGLTEKFSGVLGPIVFGGLVVLSGYTAALISTLIFFLVGLFLIRKISKLNFTN
jgi:UMF1 family MFS transporter